MVSEGEFIILTVRRNSKKFSLKENVGVVAFYSVSVSVSLCGCVFVCLYLRDNRFVFFFYVHDSHLLQCLTLVE